MGDFFAAAHRAQTTHGESKRGAHSRTYAAWRRMWQRVRGNDPCYAHVTVCARWENYLNFKADMGEVPLGKTLDRKDGSLGYSPSNCRWATPKEQANNTTRNINITFNGQTKTLTQWAESIGLHPQTLYSRIKYCGWSVERALTTPHRGWNKQGRVE